jgi:lactate dehydrogenase-like 2-hydroxyacid dehydrogenase
MSSCRGIALTEHRVTEKIDLMVVLEMAEYSRNHLAEKYRVHYWPDTATHNQRLDDPVLKKIRAVQTNGSYGLKRPMIEAMPNLEIICAVGAGFEGIDLAAARERGIIVTHGPGTNADSVADQAWALLLGTLRRVPVCDAGVRTGRWDDVRQEMPLATGKKLGIFGLGHIGSAVARRGAGGFGMDVGYFGRSKRPDSPYRYFDNLNDLAAWCDILVVCAPSDKSTYHAVDVEVLGHLGPDGYVINVSRGALLDSDALIEALRNNAIAGAGLDVIEGEPAVPEGFVPLENLVLSPHVGGFSPEAVRNMIHRVRENLDAHFAGKPVLTPVP